MKRRYFAFFALAYSLSSNAQLVNDGAVFFNNSDTGSNYFGPTNGMHNKAGSTFIGAAPSGSPYFDSKGMNHKAGAPTLTNDGTYLCSTGYYDCFVGPGGQPGVQSIAGSVRPQFYYLRIDNGDQFHITNTDGIEVNGVLQLKSVATTLRNRHHQGAIRLKGATTHMDPGLYSDARHVDGYVSKVEFQANFPNQLHVGSGTDRREIRLISPVNSNDEYSVAWISGDPSATGDPSNSNELHPITSVGPGLVAVSPVGQWDWVPVTGTGAGMTVMAFFPDMTSFGHKNQLRLAGWNGTHWVDLSGGPNAVGNGEDTCVTGTMIAGIQALAIAKVSATLPATFLQVSAKANANCSALINWRTGTEQQIRFFEVQRLEGNHWTTLGRMQPGNGEYAFKDDAPNARNRSYRIAAVNTDGSASYSPVANASFSCHARSVSISPNPASSVIRLNALPVTSTIQVRNAAGLLVYAASAGNTVHVIPVSSWPNGVYLVQVEDKGEVIGASRIVKAE